jgi:transcriptional regulator with XRE-family HTH domain
MAAPRNRTTRRLRDELPKLLAARADAGHKPDSLRSLADEIDVSQSYLSRVLGAKGERPVSRNVVGRIARALGLPVDYFPEYRAATVIEAAREQPSSLDGIYDKLQRQLAPAPTQGRASRRRARGRDHKSSRNS